MVAVVDDSDSFVVIDGERFDLTEFTVGVEADLEPLEPVDLEHGVQPAYDAKIEASIQFRIHDGETARKFSGLINAPVVTDAEVTLNDE